MAHRPFLVKFIDQNPCKYILWHNKFNVNQDNLIPDHYNEISKPFLFKFIDQNPCK